MNNSLISIITPVYNSEQYLDECIDSILKQTYNNIELILINDGSTDHSLEVCQKWAQKDSRIVLINKKNEGAAIARNKGLDIANGELIGFVDHDDVIDKNMYQVMYDAMEKKNADIVMCSGYSLIDGKQENRSYPGYDSFEVSGEELSKRMLKYEKIICSSVWSKLYRRTVIGDVRFHKDITLGDDYYFNGQIYPKVHKLYYCNEALYNYRIREGSLCRSGLNDHYADKYKVAILLENKLKKYDYITDEMFNYFRFAISYELIYEVCKYDGNKQIIKKWKKIFKNNYKSVKKHAPFSIKRKMQMLFLRNVPNTYVMISKGKY